MDAADAARRLLSARAVRERAHRMLALAREEKLTHWRLDEAALPGIVDRVVATTRAAYPDLDIPFHARWRHFVVEGEDWWDEGERHTLFADAAERARCEIDLAVVSVLLDAGAGPDWRYESARGPVLRRSEGLAIASLEMFEDGVFSTSAKDEWRADAAGLTAIDAAQLSDGFKVSPTNPLIGLEGRAALLNALGRVVAARPSVFARHDVPRPGGLYDHFRRLTRGAPLPAETILETVLAHFGPIWPSRLELGGVALGDCWRHPAIVTDDPTSGLVPFHKLSQWLTYSLIEPLRRGGIEVVDIDALTGLPEYRNGGLLMDGGALILRDPDAATRPHAPGDELIVEWRALTVALLDEIAVAMRARLGMDATTLPLAKVLQGGTWTAGREIAREKRADGGPPLVIASDGTVF
ncbi:MAG: URC4/urg3 family protein [Methylobacteriaceae bacterium]|nr:URC4/urg3 family protein [Methylobacteriaceae bacterium]